MIIVEGIDGVGKTTLVDYLVTQGMKKHHFGYDEKNLDFFHSIYFLFSFIIFKSKA